MRRSDAATKDTDRAVQRGNCVTKKDGAAANRERWLSLLAEVQAQITKAKTSRSTSFKIKTRTAEEMVRGIMDALQGIDLETEGTVPLDVYDLATAYIIACQERLFPDGEWTKSTSAWLSVSQRRVEQVVVERKGRPEVDHLLERWRREAAKGPRELAMVYLRATHLLSSHTGKLDQSLRTMPARNS